MSKFKNDPKLPKPSFDILKIAQSPELLLPATKEEREQLVKMRASVTYWKDAMRRFKRNKVAMTCAILIILIMLFAWVGPYFMPYSYDVGIRGQERLSPMLSPHFHPFGTDQLGRDLMVRVMMATRISLSIGIVASLFILIIGTTYGAISGFLGGWVDTVMMRIAEVIDSIPSTLIIILLNIALKPYLMRLFDSLNIQALRTVGPGLFCMFITFALLYWVRMARIVRGEIMMLKSSEYVTAARALGGNNKWIITKHLIPNSIGSIVITTTFEIPSAIFTESFLSFIGLGVNAPMASLGSLVNDALNGFQSYPYKLLIPASMIAVTILAFNQLGDGLRDALDPRMRD